MKYVKFLSVFFLYLILLISSPMAQDNMMKDKKNDQMTDEKMDKEMMHDNMMNKIDKDENGVAIKGYDPVAYFTDDKPVMGKVEYSYNWNDAEWHFASADHLKLFKENPTKYAPQYGGFCAYGITLDSHFSTQPDAWTIVDGKLYLNKNKDISEEWRKDIKGNIKKGDKNWMMKSSEK